MGNLEFPLYFLLIPYGIVLAYVLLFSLINLHIMARYGTSAGTAKAAMTVWMIGTLTVAAITLNLLQGTDWERPVSLSVPAISQGTAPDLGL